MLLCWLNLITLNYRLYLLEQVCMHSRCMCLRYCVLGFAARFIISSVDSDREYPFDVDPYDYMGYGTDFEESADEYYA